MLHRGKIFYEKLIAARGKIAKLASNFITDGSVNYYIYALIINIFKYFITNRLTHQFNKSYCYFRKF
jgi:hypothetical protein